MKRALYLLWLLLPICLFGQGVGIRSLNGFGTNLTVRTGELIGVNAHGATNLWWLTNVFSINSPTSRVDWSQLKNVPVDIADGTDDVVAGAAVAFTNAYIGWGDEYRTNWFSIGTTGTTNIGPLYVNSTLTADTIIGKLITATNQLQILDVNGDGVLISNTVDSISISQTATPWTTTTYIGKDGVVSKFIGDGSGLTNLNASNLASGTVADARLSSNVPLLNASNAYAGSFTGNGGGLTNLNATNLIGTISAAANLPFIPQYGSVNLTNWANATLGFLPFYDGSDFHGLYAPNESPTNALVYDSGNGFWRLGTNANIRIVGAFTGDGSLLTNLSGVSVGTVWWTNTAAAASISNAFAVKATSFAGNGGLLTGLNPANISSGTAGISITGNAVSATTATTANAGDSATAFFSTGDLEPDLMATNPAVAGLVLKATSATTAKWDTELSVAQGTNYDYITLTNAILSKNGDVRLQIEDAATSLGIGGWLCFAANTNQDYAIMSSDDGLASVQVMGDGSGNVNVTGNLNVAGPTTFTNSVNFAGGLTMPTATFTNAIFASNQPPAYATNGLVIWNPDNAAPAKAVYYGNDGSPTVTNAFLMEGVAGDGKALTNLNGEAIYWPTNAASDVTINYAKPFWFLSTNNNLSITGRSGYVATNFNQTLITITNTSAAAKTITMAATFANMNASEGNTLYCTNLGQLLVFEMNGTGTNFYWKSR